MATDRREPLGPVGRRRTPPCRGGEAAWTARSARTVWFDGSPDENYIEFVRHNVRHGLPLTLAERRLAARRILCNRPDRSDRGIAKVCGLSPRTVGRLREEARLVGAPTAHETGRGGLAETGASARSIRPRRVPASPKRFAAGRTRRCGHREHRGLVARNGAQRAQGDARRPDGDLVRTGGRGGDGRWSPVTKAARRFACPRRPGLHRPRRRSSIRGLVRVATSVVEGHLWQYVEAVPLSRVYEIADEARRRAEFWTRFAVSIEGRVRRRA